MPIITSINKIDEFGYDRIVKSSNAIVCTEDIHTVDDKDRSDERKKNNNKQITVIGKADTENSVSGRISSDIGLARKARNVRCVSARAQQLFTKFKFVRITFDVRCVQ